ncbi:unnamed protein product [Urochloa humidicola]
MSLASMSAVGNNWRLKIWHKTNGPKIPQDGLAVTRTQLPAQLGSKENESSLSVTVRDSVHMDSKTQVRQRQYQQEIFRAETTFWDSTIASKKRFW